MKTALKIFIPLAILAAGIGVTAVMVKNRPKIKPEEREVPIPAVRVLPITATTHRFKILTQGSVLPSTDIKLVSEIPGKVTAVSPSFAAGGFFKKDDVLVQLDSRDYELALTRARAVLAEAKVRLQREQAEAAVAKQEWEALGKGEASPLLLREPQLAEARAGIESAEANVKAAQLDLERTKIRAPFEGRVWSKSADVGQYLAKGEAVARIYGVDYAEIRLPIPLDELAYVDLPAPSAGSSTENGPEVLFHARLGGKIHEWKGRIVRTEGEIDPRTRMLNVVARVDDPYDTPKSAHKQPLAVGLFVEAEVLGQQLEKAFVVPRAALRGKDTIKIVDDNERLRLRQVDIVRLEKENAVVSGGLEEGELACISPLDTPVDGMRVVISTNEVASK